MAQTIKTEHPATLLIATKLDHRHDKHATVIRKRLWEKLDLLLSEDYRVVAVEAPAGYGKTTVLSQWREQLSGKRVESGWISLDPADDDPMRFLDYLSAALGSILPRRDFEATSAFLSSGPVGIDPLLAELNKRFVEDDSNFVLFLDDYHFISSRDVHEIVTRLVREAPSGVSFVIAGRYRSSLPFTQLKVNNQLVEISAEDLSFNTEEVRDFLREIKGIGIEDAQIKALRERAEGWIAGLQLAALALKDASNPIQFVEDFSGTDRDITDYLGEMVLDRQPADVRDFLLKTSILNRLTAGLCRELTGYEHSQTLLERIETENLFFLSLDRDRNWYRYHQLFSDFLQSRLEAEDGDSIKPLLRKASLWSQKKGYDIEAVDYAFRAGDIDLAASIIAEKALDLSLRRGEMHTVLEWVKRLPSEIVAKLPDVQIANAWGLTFCRRWQEMNDQLDSLEEYAAALDLEESKGGAAKANTIRASVEMNRAISTTVQDRYEVSRKLCAKWLEDWPDGDTIDTAAVATALVYSTVNTFEFNFGRRKYLEARRACELAGNYYAIAWNFASLGMIALRQGHLHEAIETYKEGLDYIAESCGASGSFMISLLSIFMAEALYEANRISEADKYLTEARPFLNNHGTVEVAIAGYRTQARLQALDGHIDAALDTLREGERLGYRSELLRLSATMLGEQIILNLRAGRTSAAKALAERKGFLSSSTHVLESNREDTQELKQVIKTRVLMTKSRERSLSILNDLIHRAKKQDRNSRLIELHILKSKVLWLSGKTLEAQREMDSALGLAAPEGFIRAFVDEGPEVHEILAKIINQRLAIEDVEPLGLSFEYLENLKAAIQPQGETGLPPPALNTGVKTAGDTKQQEKPEKLTRRERQILQLIEDGHSNCELAGLLFISEQTVKWHLHNLYTKLGARNRTGAISRAKKIELI
tara:strand:- start:8057 stop:10861 length:2805 start_codon:yes stop_codon:yes gene_type:complete